MTTTVVATASSLGNLSDLPSEVRNQIYRETSYRTKIALIQTSKMLNYEAKGFLDKITLFFHFVPSTTDDSASFTTVTVGAGDFICSLPHAAIEDLATLPFWSFPFHKVTAINFILNNPELKTVEEKKTLYKMKLYLLYAFLEKIDECVLPPIVICDEASATRNARNAGYRPEKSLPGRILRKLRRVLLNRP